MSIFSGHRTLLLLLIGPFGLLLRPAVLWSGEPAGARSVLSGRVIGLDEDALARVGVQVELRRLGAPWLRRWTKYDRPYSGNGDPRELARWLARGQGVGAPLASATVRAEAASFRFEGLGVGIHELRVVLPNGRFTTGVVAIQAEGQHVAEDLALPVGSVTLRARLYKPDGRPFRGVVVATQRELGRIASPFLRGAVEVETDDSGLAVIGGLLAGPCELTALIPGQLRVRGATVELPTDDTYEWTVDAGPVLEGTLMGRPGDVPVVGAEVFAFQSSHPELPFALARVESDDDGAFHVPVGGPGTTVLIVAAGRAPAWIRVGSETDLGAIRLAETATVTGWVRGPDNEPRPGLEVSAQPRWSFSASRPVITARTDADGRYVLSDVPPGEVRVFVRTDDWISPNIEQGWGDYAPLSLELTPGAAHRLDLAVVPALHVQGRVIDADGAPLEGALVHAWVGAGPSHVATDKQGRFVVGGLAEGLAQTFFAQAPVRKDVRLEDVTARSGGSDIELQFQEARYVTVTVVAGAAEAPVAGARVQIRQQFKINFGHAYDQAEAFTDGRGVARVGPLVASMATNLTVSAPGRRTVKRVLDLPSANAEHLLLERVQLERASIEAGLRISGRVVAPPGVALANVDLRRSDPDESLLGNWDHLGGRRMVVQSDGSFDFEVPGPGRYGLRAEVKGDDAGYWAQTVCEGGAARVEIHLRPAAWVLPKGGEWTFRIADEQGRPVPGGTAYGNVRGRADCDELSRTYWAGRLEVRAAPGTRTADWLFDEAVDACGLWLPFGPRRLNAVAPGGAPIDVVLPPESVLRGVVVGPDGRGVRGVRVRARPLSSASRKTDFPSWGADFPERSALTGEDGRFRLGGLAAGPHVLRLRGPPDMARLERLLVGVSDDSGREREIALHNAVAARVQVLGPEGKPLVGASLEIEPGVDDDWTFDDNVVIEGFYSGPGTVYETTDAEGWVGFTRLDPERGYVVWVRPPRGRDDLAAIYLPAWKPKTSEQMKLVPHVTVTGTVEDGEGVPIEGATVWARQPGSYDWREVVSARDGAFSFSELRPGALTLVAMDGTGRPNRYDPRLLHTTTTAKHTVLLLSR